MQDAHENIQHLGLFAGLDVTPSQLHDAAGRDPAWVVAPSSWLSLEGHPLFLSMLFRWRPAQARSLQALRIPLPSTLFSSFVFALTASVRRWTVLDGVLLVWSHAFEIQLLITRSHVTT